MKLIDSADAKAALAEQFTDGNDSMAITHNMTVSSCIAAINKVPAFDVPTPTEPQAQWIIEEKKTKVGSWYMFVCSRCGSEISAKRIGKRRYSYCPYCGAVMVTTERERGKLPQNKK